MSQRAPGADEVHVWTTSLVAPSGGVANAYDLLLPEERRRAEAFLRAEHRHAFVQARGWLRTILGRYLDRDPAMVGFAYGQHGKPTLAEPRADLDFNLSHSDGMALLAVSPGFPIGADIEAMREVDAKLPGRFFAAGEVARLRALPESERVRSFFRCWTRKEAYLKALGSGLATPLDAFEVTLGPDEPARLLAVAGAPDEAAHWQIAACDAPPGFMAALAARRRGWRIVPMA